MARFHKGRDLDNAGWCWWRSFAKARTSDKQGAERRKRKNWRRVPEQGKDFIFGGGKEKVCSCS